MTNEVSDWENAQQHLSDMRRMYADVSGMPGVNPYFALAIIGQLQKRLDAGERSVMLYTEIMELEG